MSFRWNANSRWQTCEARLLASFGFTADVQIFGVDEDEEVSATCLKSQEMSQAISTRVVLESRPCECFHS